MVDKQIKKSLKSDSEDAKFQMHLLLIKLLSITAWFGSRRLGMPTSPRYFCIQ